MTVTEHLFRHLRAANRALFLNRLIPGNIFTFRVIAAPIEISAAAALAQDNIPAAGKALHAHIHDNSLGVAAFREAGASKEFAVAPQLIDHRFAAKLAGIAAVFRGQADLFQLCLRLFQLHGKRLVEIGDNRAPVLLAFLNLVKIRFHVGSKTDVDNIREAFFQHIHHDRAKLRRIKMLILAHDITAADDSVHSRRVGAGATNAPFFQRLHQHSFGVARRRRGKMLLGVEIFSLQNLPFRQIRQQAQIFLFAVLVLTFNINLHEAGETNHRAGRPEGVAPVQQVNGCRVNDRRSHLTGKITFPNQLVKLVLLGVQKRLQIRGLAPDVGRTDSFVRVLNFALAVINARLLRHIILTVGFGNIRLRRSLRFRRDTRGVRSHVADKTDHAFLADVDAFKKLLSQLHRFLGQNAVLAVCFLLHAACRERRRGIAHAGTLADGLNLVFLALNISNNRVNRFLIGDIRLFAVNAHQLCIQHALVSLQISVKRPVFLRHESVNFVLTVANHPNRHGLHAPGGKPALYLDPKQRRKLVAHQPVQHAPCLLGVDSVHIQLTRRFHGFFDRVLGDFVKFHAAFIADMLQITFQMICNHFTLAVRVACQKNAIGFFRRVLQALDDAALAANRDVARLKIILDIHTEGTFGQISHMPHRGHDDIVRAKIFTNRLGFGRGFYHNQSFSHNYFSTSKKFINI